MLGVRRRSCLVLPELHRTRTSLRSPSRHRGALYRSWQALSARLQGQRAGDLFWERVRNKSELGIDVHLMHEPGSKCIAPKTATDFDIMHHNGTHRMNVHFCRCSRGVLVDNYTQLMRSRLWPATNDDPATATTISCLDQFTRLAMLGRLTGYDYYQAMAAATDAMGILKLPVRAALMEDELALTRTPVPIEAVHA